MLTSEGSCRSLSHSLYETALFGSFHVCKHFQTEINRNLEAQPNTPTPVALCGERRGYGSAAETGVRLERNVEGAAVPPKTFASFDCSFACRLYTTAQ